MRDIVCTSPEDSNAQPNRCVFLEFFSVNNTQADMLEMNKCGEIGLGPIDPNQQATSFINALYSNSLIAEKKVTFELTNSTVTGNNINFTVGGVPDSIADNGIFRIARANDAPQELGWALKVNEMIIGNDSCTTSNRFASIDLTTNISLPMDEYEVFSAKMLESGFSCNDSMSVSSCIPRNKTCEDLWQEMEDLKLRMNGGYTLHIPPKGYSKTVGKECVVDVKGWDNDWYAVGKPLLINYAIALDYSTNEVEFWPTPNAPPGAKTKDSFIPEWLTLKVVIYILIVNFVLIIIWIMCLCCKKK